MHIYIPIEQVYFRHDLLVTVKYTNNLPDVPFDPKYISYPFDPNRYLFIVLNVYVLY